MISLLHSPTLPEAAAHLRWSDWSWSPDVVAGLLLGAVAWQWILRRFPPRGRQGWFGWAALLVLAVALLSPLHVGAARLLTLHMVQHLLLMMVAAPLLALGMPPGFLGWLRRRPVVGPLVRVVWSPLPAFLAYHVILYGWHAPALYAAAVESHLVHGLQHLTFFVGSVAFWGVLLAPDPRLVRAAAGHRVVMVLAAAVLNWLLSFALALADRALYAPYLAAPRLWGLSPLDDQRLAGGVMWVMGNMMYGAALLWLLFGAFHQDAQTAGGEAGPIAVGRPGRPTGPSGGPL